MSRLTVEKPTEEMSMTELAHNCMYAKDKQARYRDFEIDMDLRDFIRGLNKTIGGSSLSLDNEDFDDELFNSLQYSLSNKNGLIAFIYRLMWAMAGLRECLKAYEDIGEPEELAKVVRCKDCRNSMADKRRDYQFWCDAHARMVYEDDYCVDGCRKEDTDNVN